MGCIYTLALCPLTYRYSLDESERMLARMLAGERAHKRHGMRRVGDYELPAHLHHINRIVAASAPEIGFEGNALPLLPLGFLFKHRSGQFRYCLIKLGLQIRILADATPIRYTISNRVSFSASRHLSSFRPS